MLKTPQLLSLLFICLIVGKYRPVHFSAKYMCSFFPAGVLDSSSGSDRRDLASIIVALQRLLHVRVRLGLICCILFKSDLRSGYMILPSMIRIMVLECHPNAFHCSSKQVVCLWGFFFFFLLLLGGRYIYIFN